MMAFGASRKLLEKWAGPAGLELHNDIMIGQGDIISAEPAQRIRAMGRMLAGNDELRGQLAAGRRRAGSPRIRNSTPRSRAISTNSPIAAPRS